MIPDPLLKIRSGLRDFASRNFVFDLLAQTLIYLIWLGLMSLGMLLMKWSEPAGIGLAALGPIAGIWLFRGLDERRRKNLPDRLFRLEWFRLN